jgi:hypothetical protein
VSLRHGFDKPRPAIASGARGQALGVDDDGNIVAGMNADQDGFHGSVDEP